MVQQQLDGVSFRLNTRQDLAWLHRYGTVFSAIDETGSGCLCFGVQDGAQKYFVKVAGADTIAAEVSPAESVRLLQSAMPLYRDLRHPNLVELLEEYPLDNYHVAVFRWAAGECLFDHWNFDRYRRLGLPSPKQRFAALPAREKLAAAAQIFSFLELVAARGYVAVDFYDGSLMYDFDTGRVTVCDIDLFRKRPAANDMGRDFWGSRRLKSPEEYRLGAPLDERTNVFTMGALLFDFFDAFTQQEVEARYRDARFLPCARERWALDAAAWRAACRAVAPAPEDRYPKLADFRRDFLRAAGPF